MDTSVLRPTEGEASGSPFSYRSDREGVHSAANFAKYINFRDTLLGAYTANFLNVFHANIYKTI